MHSSLRMCAYISQNECSRASRCRMIVCIHAHTRACLQSRASTRRRSYADDHMYSRMQGAKSSVRAQLMVRQEMLKTFHTRPWLDVVTKADLETPPLEAKLEVSVPASARACACARVVSRSLCACSDELPFAHAGAGTRTASPICRRWHRWMLFTCRGGHERVSMCSRLVCWI